MDYYLDEEKCYQRLEDEFIKYGKLIVVVDYDDTLYDFHKKGRTYNDMFALLKRWEGYSDVIIFTAKDPDEYPPIIEYLRQNNIKYLGINCDSPIGIPGRKIYANVYMDDRGGLPLTYKHMMRLIEKIEKGEVVHE